MKEESKGLNDRFLDALLAGKLETVTLETHPFLKADDMDMCDRCGQTPDDPSNELIYRSSAWRHGNDRVSPVIVKECPACVEIENRFDGAAYAAA